MAAGKIDADDVVTDHDPVTNPRPTGDDVTNAELQLWAEFDCIQQHFVYCRMCVRIMEPGDWFCANDECGNALVLPALNELLQDMSDVNDQLAIREQIAQEQGEVRVCHGTSATAKMLRMAKATAKAAGVLSQGPEPASHVPPAASASVVSGLAAADTLFLSVPDISKLNPGDYVPDDCNPKHTRPKFMQDRQNMIIGYGREGVTTHCQAFATIEHYTELCHNQRIGPMFVIKRKCLANGDTQPRNYFFDQIDKNAEVRAADEIRAHEEEHGDGARKAQRRGKYMAKHKERARPPPEGRARELLDSTAQALGRERDAATSGREAAGTWGFKLWLSPAGPLRLRSP